MPSPCDEVQLQLWRGEGMPVPILNYVLSIAIAESKDLLKSRTKSVQSSPEGFSRQKLK